MRDVIGERMKAFYEDRAKTQLLRRMPAIIRVDGKAFHTFTKGMEKPFDGVVVDAMQATMEFMCRNIQGCVLGYVQSDEISLLLIDYAHLDSSAWFDYEVEKMCSVSASMATLAFNKRFQELAGAEAMGKEGKEGQEGQEGQDARLHALSVAAAAGAMFDARAFSIPKEDACNYFYWRQQDAIRNSVNSCAQMHFSQKELSGRHRDDVIEMLEKAGFHWC